MRCLPKSIHAQVVVAILALLFSGGVSAAVESDSALRIYIDADFTHASASSVAIEQGIRTALSEEGNLLDGRPVEILRRDHHGNTRRSQDNIALFAQDKQALAIFTGMHSPPVLANLQAIHENHLLTLVPWAAAGQITRYPSEENWVFRLSVDDTKAGDVLIDYALSARGLKKPVLLLEDTGWGSSNMTSMQQALKSRGHAPAEVFQFKWGLSEQTARDIYRDVLASGADAIILVANAPEAETLVRAMNLFDQAERLPIISHWGITGGSFAENLGYDILSGFDLVFLQTSFSFLSQPDSLMGQKVLKRAMQLFPEQIGSAKDIRPPTGFIHAYDLTRLLIAAVRKVGLTNEIEVDRQNVRAALENLPVSVPGLIKLYQRPFRPFHKGDDDAHEALGRKDLTLARYEEDLEIFPLDLSQKPER